MKIHLTLVVSFVSALLILTNCSKEDASNEVVFEGYLVDIETKLPIEEGKVCIHQYEGLSFPTRDEEQGYIDSQYDTLEVINGYYSSVIPSSQSKRYYQIIPIK